MLALTYVCGNAAAGGTGLQGSYLCIGILCFVDWEHFCVDSAVHMTTWQPTQECLPLHEPLKCSKSINVPAGKRSPYVQYNSVLMNASFITHFKVSLLFVHDTL